MPSSFLYPSLLSFSLPKSPHRSSQLQLPANNYSDLNHSKTKQGKLCFAALTFFDRKFTENTSLESTNTVKKNDKLLTEEVFGFDEENGRLPKEVNQVLGKKNERLPTIVEGEIVDLIEENGRTPTRGGKNTGLTIRKEVGVWGSVKRDDKLVSFQVFDFLERIKALSASKRIEILDYFEKDGRSPVLRDFNNLLMELVKADELEFALKLFDKFPSYGLVPDSRTFSVIIRCYCKKNDPDEAKQVLDLMVANGLIPNVATFTILINSYCRRGRLQKAFEVFAVMSQIGCEPTVQTYNCLISGLCYVGRVEEAFELLMAIKKSSKKPDIYTYTTVMDGFCKVGRSDEGMELLEEALEMGLKPNVVTFNTLFNGYCKEGRPLEGISLLKQMKERNCQPDCISYSTLLHGLLKWSEIPAALQIYREMLGIGFEVDGRMMNILLKGICRRSWTDGDLLKDAEEVFERIKIVGSGPHPGTYCLMIQTFSIRGEIDKALANLHEMITLGYPPRMITFNTVIRALCGKRRVDDAMLVLVLMFRGSTFRSRIPYNLIIDELNQQGRFLDASNVYGAALKRGVIPHLKPREYSMDEKVLLGDVWVQEVRLKC